MGVATVSGDVRERLRRIRVEEYHRMIEAGILGEDERVQLIDGMLVAMTPQGRAHAFVIQELTRILVRQLGDDFRVLSQLPLTLAGDSEPEPDIAVVRAREAASSTRHPGTALLVIEVAGESLRFDRQTKAAVYARHAIPEYWIVNLADAAIEVHRDPDPSSAAYRRTFAVHRGDALEAQSVEGVRLDVGVLFP
jgi:Uma2 family endonuclease